MRLNFVVCCLSAAYGLEPRRPSPAAMIEPRNNAQILKNSYIVKMKDTASLGKLKRATLGLSPPKHVYADAFNGFAATLKPERA